MLQIDCPNRRPERVHRLQHILSHVQRRVVQSLRLDKAVTLGNEVLQIYYLLLLHLLPQFAQLFDRLVKFGWHRAISSFAVNCPLSILVIFSS